MSDDIRISHVQKTVVRNFRTTVGNDSSTCIELMRKFGISEFSPKQDFYKRKGKD
jgi:hypothetical protein